MGNLFGIIFVRPLGLILAGIFSLVQNYAVALILFTILVKLILLPFMYKQKKGMKKMNKVQVESQIIQRRYAKNKEKANEEIQKLYEREGVNPMSSCLLSFITLPIMMGLYYAVRQPLTYMMGLAPSTITEIAKALGSDPEAVTGINGQIELAKLANDNWESVSHFASEGLTRIDFNFLGIDLSATPHFTALNALWLIPIISGITALLSSLIMRNMQNKMNPEAAKNANPQMNGTMNSMLIMMPLMQIWIAFTLPASMGLYWITNNIFTMLQEVVLTGYIELFGKAEDTVEEKERKSREAAHQQRLQEHEAQVQSGEQQEYRGAKSANVSKKKLKALEAEQKRLKDKETAERAAQIKAAKEAARRAGLPEDDETN